MSIGVATVANKKALFVMLVDCVPQFEASWSQFFTEFDWFIVLMSRIDDFCANDNNNNDTTDYFTPCSCAQGNNVKTYQFSNLGSGEYYL